MTQSKHKRTLPTYPGRFTVYFETASALETVKQAAALAQANLKGVLRGPQFPNISLFIAQAALKEANAVLAKNRRQEKAS